jgi:uncharacterized membrane protein
MISRPRPNTGENKMPTMSADRLTEKAQALEVRIKDKGETLDPAERRALGKKLRRLQRKRRRVVTRVQQAAPKAPDEKKDE